MDLNPTDDEAMAALYNLGCALSKDKQWKAAADAIVLAINDYRLRLAVALKVPAIINCLIVLQYRQTSVLLPKIPCTFV